MRVLIACEESATIREEFKARGHDAWSCDLKPTRVPGKHYQGNALKMLCGNWDLLIAHPPCTRICNSGVRWLEERGLWSELDSACEFFKRFLDANIYRIAVENPIPHKYAIERIGRTYSQKIQPYHFGHGETKATCLWLKNLPPLMYQGIHSERVQRLHKLPPSEDRSELRSVTYKGIAIAMAEQWGRLTR